MVTRKRDYWHPAVTAGFAAFLAVSFMTLLQKPGLLTSLRKLVARIARVENLIILRNNRFFAILRMLLNPKVRRFLLYAPVVGAALGLTPRAIKYAYKKRKNEHPQSDFHLTTRFIEQTYQSTDHVNKALDVIPRDGHSMPDSLVNQMFERIAMSSGCIPYFISTARGQEVLGSRLPYDIADHAHPTKCDPIPANAMLCFVNVDQADIPSFMCLGHPMLLLSHVPTAAVYLTSNTVSYVADNQLVTQCNMGRTWTHPVWDYEQKHMSATKWNYFHPSDCHTFRISQVLCGPHRRIISMTPVSTHRIPPIWRPTRWAYVAAVWLTDTDPIYDHPLRRRELSFGYANIIMTYRRDKNNHLIPVISLSSNTHVANRACVNMDVTFFVALMARLGNVKVTNVSQVERYLKIDGKDVKHQVALCPESPDFLTICAPILYDALNALVGERKLLPPEIREVSLIDLESITYQATAPLVSEDGKSAGRVLSVIGPVIANALFAPAMSYNNDRACCYGRLERVRPPDNIGELNPTSAFMSAALDYFITKLLEGVEGTGVPADSDEVLDNQNSPSQMAGYNAVASFLYYCKMVVQAFQKKEPYGKVTYPRNISPMPHAHRHLYSQFMYALSEVLKRFDFYGPGKKPAEISDRMHDVAKNSRLIFECDASKFDGTKSTVNREFFSRLLSRFFAPEYKAEALRLFNDQIGIKGYTQNAYCYDLGTSQASGSADTTVANTMDESSRAYLYYVQLFSAFSTKKEQPEYYYERAWQAMLDNTVCYGDDLNLGIPNSISPGTMPPERFVKKLSDRLTRVFTASGQIMKIIPCPKNTPVTFLARVWPDPWVHNGNCTDVTRALSKINYSAADKQKFTDSQALLLKAVSLYVTDSHTPAVGPLTRRIIQYFMHNGFPEFTTPLPDAGYILRTFLSEEDSSTFTLSPSTLEAILERFDDPVYPVTVFRDEYVGFLRASNGFDCDEYESFLNETPDHLDSNSNNDCTKVPFLWPRPQEINDVVLEIDAVVGGELLKKNKESAKAVETPAPRPKGGSGSKRQSRQRGRPSRK